MVTKRKVLQNTVAAGVAAIASAENIAFSAENSLAAEPGWFDKPMRWAQLNSTEDDVAEMDIGFWMDYFRRIHADALCITAGGVVAFYPTKIKYHRPSRWLSRRPDYLRQVIEGCRKLGMAVVARTDPHATYEDVYRDHPDWIAVDAEGRKRRHWEMPDMWVTCALGPYNFEFMTEVTKEIVATFPEVGGVFSNRWEGSGICYCEHCVRSFRDYCGMDLPRTNDQRDPARRNYIGWREKRLFDLSGVCGIRRSAGSTPPPVTSQTRGAPTAVSICGWSASSRRRYSRIGRGAAASWSPGPMARTAKNIGPRWAVSQSAGFFTWV